MHDWLLLHLMFYTRQINSSKYKILHFQSIDFWFNQSFQNIPNKNLKITSALLLYLNASNFSYGLEISMRFKSCFSNFIFFISTSTKNLFCILISYLSQNQTNLKVGSKIFPRWNIDQFGENAMHVTCSTLTPIYTLRIQLIYNFPVTCYYKLLIMK